MSDCGCHKHEENYVSCGKPSYNNTCPTKEYCDDRQSHHESNNSSKKVNFTKDCEYRNNEFRHSLGNYAKSAYYSKQCCSGKHH